MRRSESLLLSVLRSLDYADGALAVIGSNAVRSIAVWTLCVAGVPELKVAAANQEGAAFAGPRCVVAFCPCLGASAAGEPHGHQLQLQLVVDWQAIRHLSAPGLAADSGRCRSYPWSGFSHRGRGSRGRRHLAVPPACLAPLPLIESADLPASRRLE